MFFWETARGFVDFGCGLALGFPDVAVCGSSLFVRRMLLVVVGCVWVFVISFEWFAVVVAFV